ncbi:Uncharacterised protein [Mycobacteroides abscessus subsp. abscessus]|nr:Uncharacterised protein [Mycobacteroides abscessus subsp. abscessus]
MVVQVTPSGPISPAISLPSEFTMVTLPSTPSPAVTVTGASTATPTAPSLTDIASLGTSRSA